MRPDRIGDVVLSTPLYHTLKDSFPESFVAALVSPFTAPLLEKNPYIDAILTDTPAGGNSDKGFWAKTHEIGSYNFTMALLLMPTRRLALMLFLAGIRRRIGVGHILYEVLTLMEGVSRHRYSPLRHESDYMLDMARRIGARKLWTTPEIFLSAGEKSAARGYLAGKGLDEGPIIGIHPGSGRSAPNWTIDRYVGLAKKISESGHQVLVTGSETERHLAELFHGIGAPGVYTSFGELSLRELAAVISRLGCLISSSTGPMHIAAALGIPTISMFCPLTACSPKLWGPLGNTSVIVTPDDKFCAMQCPGDPHICTFGSGEEGITVDTIVRGKDRVRFS